jgi:hypothetical protein
MQEKWKHIRGYETRYAISSFGRVFGYKYNKFLKPKRNPKRGGHQHVSLFNGVSYHDRFIHHLVLEAFVGERPSGTEACHNDGNSANNRLDNLRWDTHKNNMKDADRHGKFNSRLDKNIIRLILRDVNAGENKCDIRAKYSICDAYICCIISLHKLGLLII